MSGQEEPSNRGLENSNSPWPVWRAAAIIAIAALAAYHNTFSSPFIFDDRFSIADNPTIRNLSRLGEVLSPPVEAGGVTGRPIVNLTFAINYALGGLNVGGYHAFNLTFHILVALTLFGVVRRTLGNSGCLKGGPGAPSPGFFVERAIEREKSRARSQFDRLTANCVIDAKASSLSRGARPTPDRIFTLVSFLSAANSTLRWGLHRYGSFLPRDRFALAVAVIWAVHPLLTESVTCVVQRNEVLVGWFYLLTLYAFIRAVEPDASWRWGGLTVVACALGMASKEVMVSAPLMTLLYDRTFVAGSFREAWRRRWRLHAGLASTWLLLGWLMLRSQHRGGTVGFGLGISAWDYLLTQCQAIVLYLRLSFWPGPLVVDYGDDLVKSLATVAPQAALLVLLAGGTAMALWRRPVRQAQGRPFDAAQGRPVPGFLGAWFFMILAPSSSVVPLATQTIAEHRMYLPLVAVIVLALAGLHAAMGRRSRFVWPVLALLLGGMTILRNADYHSGVAIWEDTLAKRPNNARAHYNLAVELQERPGRRPEAIAHFEQALRLKPDYAGAHDALALLLAQIPERRAEALAHYEEALRLKPDYADAHNNLAVALAKIPARQDEALAHYEAALRLNPKYADAHANFAESLARIPGRLPEALAHFEEALRLNPRFAAAHYNLANALAALPGRVPEAIAHYQEALRLAPDLADAHYNLALALAAIPGRLPEAIAQYEAAVRLEPTNASMRNNLAVAYASSGRIKEAISQLKTAIEVDPTHRAVRENLEKLQGR